MSSKTAAHEATAGGRNRTALGFLTAPALLLGTSLPAMAACAGLACTAGSDAELRDAIDHARLNPHTAITFTSDIVLSGDLPILQGTGTVIDGAGYRLDGADSYRGFLVYSGDVAISNLTFAHTVAIGGNGGTAHAAGGGGMGAGGALFIRGDLGASVTLRNVLLLDNAAHGGAGGQHVDGVVSGGGGGGLGGAGGSGNPAINNGGHGGGGAFADQPGMPSLLDGTGGAGGGPNSGAGGAPDNDGTAGGEFSGGGGGGENVSRGGDGGFGGGGGGGGNGIHELNGGGDGGFGGGGGGSITDGGDGGFGGGGGSGGGGSRGDGGGGGFGGGGGGGGGGSSFGGGGGGGGAGMGGAIFVTDGGTLIIAGHFDQSGGIVTGGGVQGVNPGAGGQAFGSAVFLQGSGMLNFAPDAISLQIVSDAIADETGVIANGYGYVAAGFTAGQWGINKTGAGTLLLAGSNLYSGNTQVAGGTLLVNGSIAASALTSVAAGATLGGNGIVGNTAIHAGGILAPGNSIGTLRFAKDLTFEPGALYQVEVNPLGEVAGVNNDLAVVTGTVTIAPTARVQVLAEDGNHAGAPYAPGKTYTIITATGGVTGAFDPTVAHNFAFLDAELRYVANNVLLSLTYAGPDFTPAATTPNELAAAGAFNSFDPSDPAYIHLLGASLNQARTAFNTASGEAHASGQHLIDQTFALFQSSLGGRGGAAGGKDQTAPLAYGPHPGEAVASLLAIDALERADPPLHSAWLQPMGGAGTIEADGNAAQLDWWSGGVALGYEGEVATAGGSTRFGFGLGYLAGGASVPARASSLEGQGGYVGLYGGWSDGVVDLAGSLAYGASHLASRRNIRVGALTQTATAGYWAHSVGIELEGSYGFALTETVKVSPVGTLRAAWSGHNGTTETGAGALNATIDPASFWQLDTGLGLELAYETVLKDGAVVTLTGRALWEHAFGTTRPVQTLALAGGGGPFTVAGPEAGRDRLKLGAGLSYQPAPGTTLSLDYAGSFLGSQQSHTGAAGLKVAF